MIVSCLCHTSYSVLCLQAPTQPHRPPPSSQHSVKGLVQLAGCLPFEARCGPLMSAFAELCGDTVRASGWWGDGCL